VPILKDVFSRFGNLIDVYLIGQKTCGYVKYASKESADLAMKVISSNLVVLKNMHNCNCILTGFLMFYMHQKFLMCGRFRQTN
jgi:hypothetical protein